MNESLNPCSQWKAKFLTSVYNLFFRTLQSRNIAGDPARIVFVKAYKGFPFFGFDDHILSSIYRAAVNQALVIACIVNFSWDALDLILFDVSFYETFEKLTKAGFLSAEDRDLIRFHSGMVSNFKLFQ